MKIGTAPISWGISEFPDWGPQKPYADVLDEMARAGYEGTELGPAGFLPADPAALGAELARRNLRLIAAFVPVDWRSPRSMDDQLRDVEATAKILADLGGEYVIVADDGDATRHAVAGRPEATAKHGLSSAQWDLWIDCLHEAAARCGQLGLGLAVHPHGGSYIEHPQEIEDLLARSDPNLVKLCFDTGHITFGGGDPLDFVTRHGDRVGIVHLKDIDMQRLKRGVEHGDGYVQLAQKGVFVPLGTGSLDLPAILQALHRADYDGWVVVEQDRVVAEGQDTLADARRNFTHLSTLLGA